MPYSTAALTLSYWLVSLTLWSLIHLGEPLPRIEFGVVEAPQPLNTFWKSSCPCVNSNTGSSTTPTPPKRKIDTLICLEAENLLGYVVVCLSVRPSDCTRVSTARLDTHWHLCCGVPVCPSIWLHTCQYRSARHTLACMLWCACLSVHLTAHVSVPLC